ncbi:Hint domain-containing protein [Pseudoroseicyclus sp. CXY001]|uniref:Hint domain-containing protein n=1 Tax=Pseudoroseicyclus sp. CXY001 TaxID=3242492 RepID=UPI00358DCA41
MKTVTLYLTGDQIGTFTSVSHTGNGDDMVVTLDGTQALGGPEDIFKLEVRQVGDSQDEFTNGQWLKITPYQEGGGDEEPIVDNLDPQHDMFQGRASSTEHQIFVNPGNYVIDLNGIDAGTMTYGPGPEPVRADQLPFSCFPSTPPTVPCFAAGTLIDTPDGPRKVEELAAGDMVLTRDHGARPIVWVGRRRVPGRGRLAPVEIAAGALGNARPLRLSQQHRVLLEGWRVALHFGETEALTAAKHLVNDSTIRIAPCDEVEYVHLALDAHEILFAEGLATESLHLGPGALASMGHEARAELLEIFPELEDGLDTPLSRLGLAGWEGRLAARLGA